MLHLGPFLTRTWLCGMTSSERIPGLINKILSIISSFVVCLFISHAAVGAKGKPRRGEVHAAEKLDQNRERKRSHL